MSLIAPALVQASTARGVVIAVVLMAAVAHAAWNLVAKRLGDQAIAFLLINAAGVAGGALLWSIAGTPMAGALPFLGGSVALHVVYNVALLNSYRFGDLSRVYPIARGLAPLLVTAGAVAAAGEGLGTLQLVGVAVVAGGVASFVVLGEKGQRHPGRSLVLAGATGVLVAAYSLLDGLGVRHAHDTVGYAGLLFFCESSLVVAGLATWRRGTMHRVTARMWLQGGAAGALSVVTYIAVLWAQTRLALGVVSALRETSVVAAALFGAVALHEGHAVRRLVGALAVCVGVALLVVA